MLMKRDDAAELYNGGDDVLHADVAEYLKREFSAEQRRSAAESGAALPDGSFPIHNKSDLHNAMQAIGRAKDPAKAKAHIRRRAKALGLSGELSDAFKSGVPYAERVAEFFADLFKRKDDGLIADNFDDALAGLAESVKSIMDDDGAADKHDMLAKTFTQFHDHVSPLIGDRASPQQPTDTQENPMSAALMKALGLKEDASEEDALKKIAEMAKARRRNGNGNGNGDKDKEDDDDEEEEDDEEKRLAKAFAALPASIRKSLADGAAAIKRVQKLEDEAALVRALTEKRIKGAALDVYDCEPLPQGHPLYYLENVLLSPHCADHTATWQDAAMDFFLAQFERFRKGEPLLNVVDKDLGY